MDMSPPEPSKGGRRIPCWEPTELYDGVAAEYDDNYKREVCKAENQVIFTWLFNHHCLAGRILDAGCGTGLLLEFCQPSPRRYLGVDISTGMLREANRKFPKYTFLCGDIRDLSPMEDSRCSVYISLFGVVNYPDDLDAVIAEMKRVLVDRGRYFIMFYSRKYRERKSYILQQVQPALHFYSPVDIVHAFNRNGLDPTLMGMNTRGDDWEAMSAGEIIDEMIEPVNPDDGYFIIAKGLV